MIKNKFLHFHNSLGQRFCTVRYIEPVNILTIIWKGPGAEKSILQVKQGIMEMVQQYQCTIILDDVQDFFTAGTESLARLTTSEWNKEVVDLGVKYIAQVLKPKREFTSTQEVKSGLTIRFFSTTMDAMAWIRAVQASLL